MAAALTAPLASVALLLVVASVAKLRAPRAAADAIGGLRLPASPVLVRAGALLELGLGAWTLASGDRAAAIGLAGVFVAFSGLSLALARRGAPCGCFGERSLRATSWHAALTAACAGVAGAAAAAGAHPLGWAAGHGSATGAVLLAVAAAGAAWALVLAFTELPAAWSVWGGG